jgi:hypothetical protein
MHLSYDEGQEEVCKEYHNRIIDMRVIESVLVLITTHTQTELHLYIFSFTPSMFRSIFFTSPMIYIYIFPQRCSFPNFTQPQHDHAYYV